jgi:magnesium transporter
MTTNAPVDLETFLKMHPADLADELQRLPIDEARDILLRLPRPQGAAALSELDEERSGEILERLDAARTVELFRELQPSEIADLVAVLPGLRRREALSGLPAEKAAHVRNLLRYPEDTAGGIMSDRFISLRAEETVQECQDRLRRLSEQRSDVSVSYLYVTDEAGRMVGVVPIRDLVFARPDRRIGDICHRDVQFVRVDDDQEEIARNFEHYHYLGLPVLDQEGRLVGVVKASDALQVAQAEATEDMQLMVGLSGEERALTPWHKAIKKRLPWLYLNLATALLAAAVVGMFESTIAGWTALAIFLPIIAGQGGNAGMQTLTIIIRDMALGELSPGDGRKALFKEATLGFFNGIAIGVVVGLIGVVWKGDVTLGIVAGLAMMLNQLAAALSGVMIPFGLKMFHIDPALASSIFVTTVTDVAGIFFFLGLATLAMKSMGG